MTKYNHTEEWHTIDAGLEIVPVVMRLLKPRTVVDVGCGIGTFTKVFKENGAKILGIDGPWCKKDLLFKNIEPSEFLEVELEKEISLSQRFDLVVCLEVAEHLTPGRAETFVRDLTRLGDIILFSAAIPNQGGENHFNEQWPEYWQRYFSNFNCRFFDCLRPIFWENKKIFYWYKQNVFLVVKEGIDVPGLMELKNNSIQRIVHPELLDTLVSYKEKNSIKRSLKLLVKAIAFRLGFIK